LALEPEPEYPLRFRHDRVRRIAEGLHLQLRDHAGKLDDRAVDIGNAMPMHERRCRRKPLHEAEIERRFDFLEIYRVEVKIHRVLNAPRASGRGCGYRAAGE